MIERDRESEDTEVQDWQKRAKVLRNTATMAHSRLSHPLHLIRKLRNVGKGQLTESHRNVNFRRNIRHEIRHASKV